MYRPAPAGRAGPRPIQRWDRMSGCLSIGIRRGKHRGRCPSWCARKRVPSRPPLPSPKPRRQPSCGSSTTHEASTASGMTRFSAGSTAGSARSRAGLEARDGTPRQSCPGSPSPRRCAGARVRSWTDRRRAAADRQASGRRPRSRARHPVVRRPWHSPDRGHPARHDEPVESGRAGRARGTVGARIGGRC